MWSVSCMYWAGSVAVNRLERQLAKLLRDERRRAVRVVRCELEKYQRQREGETNASRRDMLGGAMLACYNILTALQRGRE